ncbi:MAG: peptidylprolyl isomerase [Gammaproteobacteria bacterium]|nr:peptidylprolyl isomerase [Gammaproteobacteria bacterium]
MRLKQVFTAFIIFTVSLAFSPATTSAESLDKIVVEINNQIITESELQKRIADIRQQILSRKSAAPSSTQLRNKVLDRMVLDLLQVEHAKQFGIRLTQADLNMRIESIAQKNKLSVPQLRQALLKDGINFADFRQQIERDTIISRVQKGLVFDKIKVSDHEIEQFLLHQKKSGSKDNRYHLSHILIAVPENANSESLKKVRNKAQSVLKKLHAGQDFDKIAIEYSNGQKALEGGDLGWRSATELPSLFVSAASKLKKGQLSGLIQSPSGFHILKLHAKDSQQQVIVEETLVRHILIKVDAITNDKSAREKLEALHKQLKAGADFAKLARQHSEDSGSKSNGGSLGWSVAGSFVPQFEAVMKSLKKQQISQPFRTTYGWHLMQVLDRRQSDKTKIIMRNKAHQKIQASKADEALELWLRRLRDEAYIKYHNPADAPG